MRLTNIQDAQRSSDPDIKQIAVRASRYRMFGSAERIHDPELAVADMRKSGEPENFNQEYEILERHPLWPIYLVRRITTGS